MYCNYCGKVIQDDANHCAYCGTRVGGVMARKKLIRPRVGRKIAGVEEAPGALHQDRQFLAVHSPGLRCRGNGGIGGRHTRERQRISATARFVRNRGKISCQGQQQRPSIVVKDRADLVE